MHPNLPPRRTIAVGLLALAASLVAAPAARAQLFAGGQSGTDQGWFAWQIANAGDVDLDGARDFIVAEPNYVGRSGKQQGRVSIYSGATFNLIRSHIGAQSLADFGFAIGGVGDLNSDHYADYAVDARYYDSNGLTDNGRVFVYSGKDGSVLWTVDGTSNGEFFGDCITGIDDVNGDLKADLLIGNGFNDKTSVYDSGGSLIYTLHGGGGRYFGSSAAICGDLDGDGVRDFVVGDPEYGTITLSSCGAAHVFSAATGTELFTITGTAAGDELGATVSSLRDVDGDGISDLLAGSAWGSNANYHCGVVRVASGADGSTIREVYGDVAYDLLGSSLVGMGDMDHDGVDDYAAGARDGGASQFGYVRVWSGATGALIYEWQGTHSSFNSNGDLGRSLAAGDFNGDGIADLVLGDPIYSTYDPVTTLWSQPGGAFMYWGCPSWSDNYGTGWPGKNGIPAIAANDKPVPGNDLHIHVDNSLGIATTGLLFVGFDQQNVVTGKGGTLLVDPALTVVFPLGSTGATLAGHLPDDPAIYFLDLYLQAIEVDPFASRGLSFTEGLHLRLGYDLP